MSHIMDSWIKDSDSEDSQRPLTPEERAQYVALAVEKKWPDALFGIERTYVLTDVSRDGGITFIEERRTDEERVTFWYPYDETVAIREDAPYPRDQRISRRCEHPECARQGVKFTYTYKGGNPRKYHSSACASDYKANGRTTTDGERQVTSTRYDAMNAYDGRPTWSRKQAFRVAVRALKGWAREYDKATLDLIARTRPGERVPLTGILSENFFAMPPRPEPGHASVTERIVGDTNGWRFDNAAIERLMGPQRVERGSEVREVVGFDHTDASNDASARREESGSPATAAVDLEARDPMFRERAGDGREYSSGEGVSDAAADRAERDGPGAASPEAELHASREVVAAEVVTSWSERRPEDIGPVMSPNQRVSLWAKFARVLTGRGSRFDREVVSQTRRDHPLMSAEMEARIRRELAADAMTRAALNERESLRAQGARGHTRT
jgi:hypothetical protein